MNATDQVSERALTLAELLEDPAVFPEQAVWDLRRLLSHEIARYNPGRYRADDLGLLVRLVARHDDPDGWITQEQYRNANTRADDDWPSSSALARTYGSWLAAVGHAVRVWFGVTGELKGSYRKRFNDHQVKYSQREVTFAIQRCAAELGAWPTSSEFVDWGRVRRFRATTNPRIPELNTVAVLFGSYSAALSAAQELER